MRNILTAALALGGMLAAGSAIAQMADMYTTGSGDSMMMMGGSMGDKGMPIVKSKDMCTDGGYYMSGENMVTACADGGMTYEMSKPGSGDMMMGKPYPEGSMMMKEHKM